MMFLGSALGEQMNLRAREKICVPYSYIKQARREHFQTLVMRVLLELNGS